MAVSPIRVLVVDGDAGITKFLHDHFQRKNFDVNTVSSGEEAVRVFRSFDPAMVLLGTQLAGMDCLATLSRLKEIKPETAVVLLSSAQQTDLIFRASKAGADDFLAKPVDLAELDQR